MRRTQRFQFYKVRLKQKEKDFTITNLSFQFYKVRLKPDIRGAQGRAEAISILQSSIKTQPSHWNPASSRNFNSTKFD